MSLSKEIRARLAQLNRKGVDSLPPADDPVPVAVPDTCVIQIASPDVPRPRVGLRLEDAAPGRLVARPEGGAYWLIERRLSDFAPHYEPFLQRYCDLLTCETLLLPEPPRRDLVEFVRCQADRVLYLDIETTGLTGGAPLFLVGVMHCDGRDFVVRQFFARHYGEEVHLLADLADCLPRYDLLVTFNGRRFDAPYITDRATVNRLAMRWPPRHLDLLYESRRRWARILPNCRLTTLEEHICGRRRDDDIPSRLIPAAYHAFVHSEDAAQMRQVIHHNVLDLVTIAELALFMIVGRRDWT